MSIIEGGNLRYLWLGATHMLSGYDHLLFVFGIVFFPISFKGIIKHLDSKSHNQVSFKLLCITLGLINVVEYSEI